MIAEANHRRAVIAVIVAAVVAWSAEVTARRILARCIVGALSFARPLLMPLSAVAMLVVRCFVVAGRCGRRRNDCCRHGGRFGHSRFRPRSLAVRPPSTASTAAFTAGGPAFFSI